MDLLWPARYDLVSRVLCRRLRAVWRYLSYELSVSPEQKEMTKHHRWCHTLRQASSAQSWQDKSWQIRATDSETYTHAHSHKHRMRGGDNEIRKVLLRSSPCQMSGLSPSQRTHTHSYTPAVLTLTGLSVLLFVHWVSSIRLSYSNKHVLQEPWRAVVFWN